MAKLNQLGDSLEKVKTFMAIECTPENVNRYQWISHYLEENGYICWSKVSDVEEFRNLFHHNSQFHRFMGQIRLTNDIGSRTMEKDTYYYRSEFDIEPVLDKAPWKQYQADHPALLDHLIRCVIIPGKDVDLFEYLEKEYPDRGVKWRNDVLDNVERLIKGKYKIQRDYDHFIVGGSTLPRDDI